MKIVALILAAVVACTAIGTWAAANNSRSHGKVTVVAPINPLALMKVAPSNLPGVL